MLKRLFWFIHERGMERMRRAGLQVGKGTLVFNDIEDYGCDPQLIKIGSNCVIASGVRFITLPAFAGCGPGGREKGAYEKGAGGKGASDKGRRGIVVRDNCFLGVNSIIYPNVTIGPDAVIGAGAVVTEDVPPNMCVCGNPSRVTCTLDIYKAMCKRTIIQEYAPENKRRVLDRHFWNSEKQ